jgi:hypothetical protein
MFQILSYIQRDKRLCQPKNCPDWLYEMMLKCWQLSPQERAKSQHIVQCFDDQIWITTTMLIWNVPTEPFLFILFVFVAKHHYCMFKLITSLSKLRDQLTIASFNGHWVRSAKAEAPNSVNNFYLFYYIDILKYKKPAF